MCCGGPLRGQQHGLGTSKVDLDAHAKGAGLLSKSPERGRRGGLQG